MRVRLMGPLLAALFVSTVEAGGSFGIAPLVVNLDARRAQDVLEVSNSGTEPMLMQADALDWSQRTGQDQLTPSQNLLVSPPVFEVPPGGKQVLRVALLNPTVLQDGVEHAYRVQLREIPATSEDGAVHSSLGVRIPVFFASGKGEAQLRWSRATVNGAARLQVENLGPRHAQITEINLQSAGGETLLTTQQNAYVLPGATREWPLPDSAASAVQVGGRLRQGTFSAALEQP